MNETDTFPQEVMSCQVADVSLEEEVNFPFIWTVMNQKLYTMSLIHYSPNEGKIDCNESETLYYVSELQ